MSFLACMVLGKKISVFANQKAEAWVNASSNCLKLDDENHLSTEGASFQHDLNLSNSFSAYFYTSGSTGQAKKVPKTFENLYLEVKGLEKVFSHLERVKLVLSSVSHNHIYGFLFRFLWPITTGRKIFLREISYHEDLSRYSQEKDFLFLSSPAFLKRLDANMESLNNMKAIFSSGGLLSKEVSDQSLSILLTRPIEVFGSTETGGVAYRQQSNPQSLWIKFPGVEISSTEDSLLKVKSPFIFEQEFVMGDRFEEHPGGKFRLLGRADRIAKVEEKRVSLPAIEQVLNSMSLVQESAVIFLEDGARQMTCAALTLSMEGLSLKANIGDYAFKKLLKAELCKHFDLVVVPKRFRFLEELPYNSQSKIIYKDLKGYFA
ncbi:MAG: AMP-binding protein [Bdellovibrionota bacterium]|nr:AMP-binding protein [Bdellovibrionota bacterium]